MNKRQFDNMIKRRKAKQAAKPVPVVEQAPAPRVWRAPTAIEMGQVEALQDAIKDAERIQTAIREAERKIEDMQGWHLLWRARRLLELVDGKPKRPNHPKGDEGKYIPMRRLLGLPADPKRQVIDDAVGVVPHYVKSLPNKGNVPTLKLVDFREVDHAPAQYMHFRWFGPVEPREILSWLLRFGKLVESGALYHNILRMESIYGTPRVMRDFRTGTPVERLTSKGATKEGSQQIKHGPFTHRGTGAALHMQKLRDRKNRQRIREAKGHRPFRQDRRIVYRAFSIETYKKED